MHYPDTPRQNLIEMLHGVPVPDPYRWLEDIDSPEVQNWIQNQSQLTIRYLANLPGREKLEKRIESLWNFEKFNVPVKRSERIFYTRNDGLQNQPVLYWMENLEATPKELLDPNHLSEDGTIALINFEVSRDGKLLAYGTSASGSDWQEWQVREVDTGRDLSDCLEWVKFSAVSWSIDHQGFYYSRYDAPAEEQAYQGANYYHKLYYHRLGTDQSEDILVYHRPDHKEWGLNGEVCKGETLRDSHYLVISVWQGTQRENGVFYQDLAQPDNPVVELLSGFDAAYHFLGQRDHCFYFMTDLDAPQGRVIAIDLKRPDRKDWMEIVPENQDSLQEMSWIGNRLIGIYLHHAHSLVKLYDLDGNPAGNIELPGLGTVMGFTGSQKDQETFYLYTSFFTPGEVYHFDLDHGKSRLLLCPTVKFDPQDFVANQVFYPSKDGAQIPMFLCHRKNLQVDGNAPTHLYGYGGFNIPQTPAFSVGNLVWMEMGGIYALANLRGGGEYGKAWHQAGCKAQKQNVFDDFIAAAEYLIAQGYTCSSRLAISGRSNGGLLVGACLTQRPDLYAACLPVVGVLDMLRFHKFTIGWAWVSDYGSPDDPDDFRTLLAYSPYHNIKPGVAYPPTLICTGDHDDRVYPAHSFKFAAALQAAQSREVEQAPVLIRIDLKTGHGMGKPTAKLIQELADQWAFLIKHLGVEI